MDVLFKGIVLFVIATCVNIVISGFAAIVVVYCWNNVIPDLFSLTMITYRQAWFLTLLCFMLFNSTTEVS